MLRHSLVDSRPDRLPAPAFETAARTTAPTSFTSLVDLAEKMMEALPLDRQRPMEKAYAAIRLQLGRWFLGQRLGHLDPLCGTATSVLMGDFGAGRVVANPAS